jgi:hypothetical protein
VRNSVEVQKTFVVQIGFEAGDVAGKVVALVNIEDLNLWVPAAWVKPSTNANHRMRVCLFVQKVTGANPESHLVIV